MVAIKKSRLDLLHSISSKKKSIYEKVIFYIALFTGIRCGWFLPMAADSVGRHGRRRQVAGGKVKIYSR